MEKTHLRNKDAPFSAYDYKQEGDPYLFVSYAHADSAQVFPYIERLYKDRFRIWYDEGIGFSLNWIREIAIALKGAKMMLLFISPAAVKSKNVARELNYAFTNDVDVMPLYLEETTLPEEWEFLLNTPQAVHDIHASYTRVKHDLPKNTRRPPTLSPNQPPAQPKQRPADKAPALLYPQKGDILRAGDPNHIGPKEWDWLVLDVDEQKNQALLITNGIVEERAYNDEWKAIDWERCSLRDYLKNEFLDKWRFSEKDRARIALTHNENPGNTWGKWNGEQFNTPGGAPTDDRIFLLSVPEVLKHFDGLKLHKEKGNELYYEADKRLVSRFNNAGSWWWLRSPGYDTYDAAFVIDDGIVYLRGGGVQGGGGVRPALWLNLES